MFDFDINSYLDKVAMTPKEMYQSLNQATLNDRWDDTTQVYTIKEQKALPFENEYEEYEAWVDTVSDTLVNTSKVYSDFVNVLFKDVNHKQNYKGQYYIISTDGEHEEPYICYDRMNKLSQLSSFKCVRCNNVLKWIDENGIIIEMPCYLGTDISSTNNLISKDGTVPNTRMIILVQANEQTKKIVKNQRFMFEHSSTFKVEEVNNYMHEQDTNGEVTMIRIYVDYSALLPTDNKELNICDYYINNYTIDIAQDNISQEHGFKGKLSATIKNNDKIVDEPLVWSSSDSSIVTIDKFGQYELLGDDGQEATITCAMQGNEQVFDSIVIKIDNTFLPEKKIVVNPNNVKTIRQNSSIEFVCKVEEQGEIIPQDIHCSTNWKDDKYYSLQQSSNGFILYNKNQNNKPLTLTFYSDNCENVVMTIKLNGIL